MLSNKGFMGNSCKREATRITNTSYPIKEQHGKAWKAIMLITILCTMLAGWIVVFQKQASGFFLCGTIQVQFGDDLVPALGTFSGLYDLRTKPYSFASSDRVEYVQRRSVEVGSASALFAYCHSIGAWTFHWETPGNEGSSDPCDWVARSEEIDTFDLTDTSNLVWYVRDANMREVELVPFHLVCFECSKEVDCGGRGVCYDGVCSCEQPWWGYRCEFQACSDVSVDFLTESFATTRDWAEDYSILKDSSGVEVLAYDRPVYAYEYGPNDFDMIVFTGRRWALASVPTFLMEDRHNLESEDLVYYFRNQFHAHSTNLSVAFLSEPADFGTPKDDASPIGLSWYRSKSVVSLIDGVKNNAPDKSITTRLLCRICDDIENPCLYDGVCFNQTCTCSVGSAGRLCQSPPTGNGYCNDYFNTPEFKFDGGDCCELTCVSSMDFQCGFDATSSVFLGYPSCIELEDDKWYRHGDLIVGEPFSSSGFQVAISSNGAVLAIVQGASRNTVLLFDREGSSWIKRPTSLIDTGLKIESISLSIGDGSFLNTPTFLAPVLLGVSGWNATVSYVRQLYFCDIRACSTVAIPSIPTDDGRMLISTDGSTIAAGLTVLKYGGINLQASPKEAIPVEKFNLGDRDTGKAFVSAISGDGNTIAIQVKTSNGAMATRTRLMTATWNGTTYLSSTAVVASWSHGNTTSISMSDDGHVLLVTVPATGEQASFVRNNSTWTERNDLPTEVCQDRALSGDGLTIVCRTYDDGNIVAYQWNGIKWALVDRVLKGGQRLSFSLSSDGSFLAIGSPHSQDNFAGATTVYSRRQSLAAEESTFRLSFTPPFKFRPSFDLYSNASGKVFMDNRMSHPWARASQTETRVVKTEDCFVFTLHPNKPTCSKFLDNGYGDPDSPCSLPTYDPASTQLRTTGPARFDVFIDDTSVAGGLMSVTQPELCDPEHIPPHRLWLGDSCYKCPRGKKRVEVMVLACIPLQWELIGDNQVVALSSNGTTQHDTPQWATGCLDTSDICFTFSMKPAGDHGNIFGAMEGQQNGGTASSLASNSTSLKPTQFYWYYTIVVNDKVVANKAHHERNPESSSETHSFGNCIQRKRK
jgi:hypothetical protein